MKNRIVNTNFQAFGLYDEAYRQYGLTVSRGGTNRATFRNIAKKYPMKEKSQILQDLIQSTPGEEGKWFTAAKSLGILPLSLKLAHQSPGDPKTLNRAARDYLDKEPRFALGVAMASLHWLSLGWGYEITGFDVRSAFYYAIEKDGEIIMSGKKHTLSRRAFLKTTSAVCAGALVAPFTPSAEAAEESQTMPMRPFGKSGARVSILSFGGSLDTSLSLLVLRQAFKWGVTYWDTANSYMGGRSERGMGKYLEKYPGDRRRIFLVTKSHAWTLGGMSRDLDESLERLKTDYVDLFFVHSVRSPDDLDDDMKAWADKKKAQGKIRLFGFSTHSNMEVCMLAAAKLGWIDGIMMSYNYRRMHMDDMKRAVAACAGAGIGLTAMKTQGGGQIKTNTPSELQMVGRFLKKGFTDAQAKMKAVWSNPAISSICSEMPNMTILKSNVAAALDRTTLSHRDMELLQHYARKTRAHYCAGCADICESSVLGNIPVGDVMRCLMYARSYGDRERAKEQFRKITPAARRQMNNTDFTLAEQRCPQGMPIGRLMKEAVKEFAS